MATIAFDISTEGTGHGKRGTGVYAKNLIEALQKHETSLSYTLITRGEKLPDIVDLVHYPYFDPFFLTLPLRKSIPTVVTVHDLIPIAYPEHFPRGIRGEFKWNIQKFSLKNSNHIITDSKSSESMLQKFVTVPTDKISVIYLAPRDMFMTEPSAAMIKSLINKFRLPSKFLLYVGDVNWNKNIPGLLAAFASVRNKHKDLRLILVGKSFLNNELEEVKNIQTEISALDLEDSVIKTGYITDEELHIFYDLAQCYVQPSFAEGFGLPVIEAMAAGCPCVVSENSSLTEIAGPSIRVNAHDYLSIAAGIDDALSRDTVKLRRESREWSSKFTWKYTAQKTAAVYRKVLGI